MKKKYQSPKIEIIMFETKNAVLINVGSGNDPDPWVDDPNEIIEDDPLLY